MEPAITWNLLITAIGIPALAFYLKYILSKRDSLRDKLFTKTEAIILEKCELMRLENVRLTAKIDELEKAIRQNVCRDDFRKENEDIWNLLKHHSHDDAGRVVDTT